MLCPCNMIGKDSRFNRRSIRLPHFDYGTGHAYLVTICTYHRQNYFGSIENGIITLSVTGNLIQEEIETIPKQRDSIELLEWTIMPNHVHFIILIREEGTARCAPTGQRQFGKLTTGTLPVIVRAFKSASSRRFHQTDKRRKPLWQRGYHEHVIRTEDDLRAARQYLIDNPQQWQFDHDNPDCLTK